MLAPCPEKTRTDLEWDRLLEALAQRARSDPGKALALELPFCGSIDDVRTALDEGREALALDALGEPLPQTELASILPAVERARIGSTLSNDELRDVGKALGAARSLRRFLHAHREQAPMLLTSCATDPALDELERLLRDAFEPDGTLSDRASPKLAALRSESRAARARLLRRLEEILSHQAASLQDAYWTERDGRYVLPVRADSHDRVPGIVHGASASGATLYVEPKGVIDLGNRLKMLEADIHREEQAIYAALSARLTEHVPALIDVERALAHADVRGATATLAKDVALSFPEVLDSPGEIDLLRARHPLLTLSGVKVVPSHLTVSRGQAVVVSGPNAGGKTVALKVLGLSALLVRAGLPVPAGEGSRVSFFERVLTDVGDEQSLRNNLSTFSAHVRNIAAILDDTHEGVLVLLDELAGGTDPREGEALAAAVLDSLCARGGTVVCTTHYEGLKALAVDGGRFVNASVGFDLATLSPTFRLAIGVPGSSSALAVAQRFGMPGPVVERARGLLATDAARFDATIRKLEDERRSFELARMEVDRERADLDRRERDLERKLVELTDKERRAAQNEGAALIGALKRARIDLQAAETRLKKKNVGEDELREAAKVVDAVAKKVSIGGELGATRDPEQRPRVRASDIRLGLKVFLPRIRATGEIIEIMAQGQVRLAAGAMKVVARIDELCVATAAPKAEKRRAPVPFDAAADPDVPIQTTENTVDLRGLRADEAVSMAEQFLDRSLQAGRRVAFLIHGHGTGALRLAVRSALGASGYVTRTRPGGDGEGGDGVTVAWLR